MPKISISRTDKSLPIDRIKPYRNNSRTHSNRQTDQIAGSMKAFGVASPLVVDENCVILAGHGRWEAAKKLALKELPVVVLAGLSEAKKRAFRIADNRIAQNAGWDRELQKIDIDFLGQMLVEEGIDLSITGMEPAEIDALHEDFAVEPLADDEELLPEGTPVTQRGDCWLLGPNRHRLACGDARDKADLARLMDGQTAQMAFMDPPFNIPVSSIGGRGRIKHREFAMASGELSDTAFRRFLRSSLRAAAAVSNEGALHYVCMDWRNVECLLAAGRDAYGATINILVWVKTNAGQGSFYRSQHEFIVVFRVGKASHTNNIQLGRHGNNRSNVWRYAGVNTFRKGRLADLAAHPTVKPVAMIADAMKDCTLRGQNVLDTFCGSGSTILAAEKVGRRAFGLEIDPLYVDVAVRRWQAATGRDAVHAESGVIFEEISRQRSEQSRHASGRRAAHGRVAS